MPELTMIAPSPATEKLVCGNVDGKYFVALVFKRAFEIEKSGHCTQLPDRLPLASDIVLAQPDLASPDAHSILWDSDLYAFKPATDLVVQGNVYNHSGQNSIDATLSWGPLTRTVRVHGDRVLENVGGRWQFSTPKPFESIPVTYQRAYGGLDRFALKNDGNDLGEVLQDCQPDYADEIGRSTPFHYPRNTVGCGYVMKLTNESASSIAVPNLEFEFDPITPERLAVGSPDRWVDAPLPATFDWYYPSWFPRIGYLGQVQSFAPDCQKPLESELGWTPPEIMDMAKGKLFNFDYRFLQGSSPGLALTQLPSDSLIRLTNLSAEQRDLAIQFPGNRPNVTLEIGHLSHHQADTRQTAIVIEPDKHRLTIVYAALCQVARPYGDNELAAMSWRIS